MFLKRSFALGLLLGVWIAPPNLGAHHPSGGGARALPDARSLRPAPQFILDSVYLKGERPNRHRLVLTGAAEVPVAGDLLSLTIEAPYTYFRQNNRDDAGRHGRARMGFRLRAPLERLSSVLNPWLLVLDGDYAPAAGRDSNVFLDEPFADARAGLTAGYAGKQWLFLIRGGGVFPASNLPFRGVDELFVAPWKPAPELIRRETHELKKTTEWLGRLGFKQDGILFFIGGLHRTPYAGVVRERRFASLPLAEFIAATALDEELPTLEISAVDLARPRPPTVYRQAEAGVAFEPAPDWTVSFSYAYPLHRRDSVSLPARIWFLANETLPPDPKRFRLHDEIYSLSVAYSF